MNHDETHTRTHEKAIADMTAESYLLGDLSDAEADAFEMHSFDCRVCADTVRAGTAMFAAGREVVKSEDKKKVIPFPPRWFPAQVAAAMFAVVIGIQSFIIWRPQPLVQAITIGPTLSGTVRAGESIETVHFEGDLPTSVGLEIPPDRPYPNYRVEVLDSSGKVLKVVNATANQVQGEQGYSLLLRPLPAGRYAVVVEGVQEDGNRSEVITLRFVVE
jgi:hypothetical protein